MRASAGVPWERGQSRSTARPARSYFAFVVLPEAGFTSTFFAVIV
jgi:hypothetical protein